MMLDYHTAEGNGGGSMLMNIYADRCLFIHIMAEQMLEVTDGYCCPLRCLLIPKAEPFSQFSSSVGKSLLLTPDWQLPTLSFILITANHTVSIVTSINPRITTLPCLSPFKAFSTFCLHFLTHFFTSQQGRKPGLL